MGGGVAFHHSDCGYHGCSRHACSGGSWPVLPSVAEEREREKEREGCPGLVRGTRHAQRKGGAGGKARRDWGTPEALSWRSTELP